MVIYFTLVTIEYCFVHSFLVIYHFLMVVLDLLGTYVERKPSNEYI